MEATVRKGALRRPWNRAAELLGLIILGLSCQFLKWPVDGGRERPARLGLVWPGVADGDFVKMSLFEGFIG